MIYYSNITILGPSQAEVVGYLKGAGRKAYVSPTVDGFTVVYDSECDEAMDPRLTARLTSEVSKAFSCKALAIINRYDYVLIYQLYECGRIIDEYFSVHDLFYFDVVTSYHVSGDVRAVCTAFGKSEGSLRLESVLAGDYDFEHKRHYDLVRALGLPDFAVCAGFGSISAGAVPGGVKQCEIARTQ